MSIYRLGLGYSPKVPRVHPDLHFNCVCGGPGVHRHAQKLEPRTPTLLCITRVHNTNMYFSHRTKPMNMNQFVTSNVLLLPMCPYSTCTGFTSADMV